MTGKEKSNASEQPDAFAQASDDAGEGESAGKASAPSAADANAPDTNAETSSKRVVVPKTVPSPQRPVPVAKKQPVAAVPTETFPQAKSAAQQDATKSNPQAAESDEEDQTLNSDDGGTQEAFSPDVLRALKAVAAAGKNRADDDDTMNSDAGTQHRLVLQSLPAGTVVLDDALDADEAPTRIMSTGDKIPDLSAMDRDEQPTRVVPIPPMLALEQAERLRRDWIEKTGKRRMETGSTGEPSPPAEEARAAFPASAPLPSSGPDLPELTPAPITPSSVRQRVQTTPSAPRQRVQTTPSAARLRALKVPPADKIEELPPFRRQRAPWFVVTGALALVAIAAIATMTSREVSEHETTPALTPTVTAKAVAPPATRSTAAQAPTTAGGPTTPDELANLSPLQRKLRQALALARAGGSAKQQELNQLVAKMRDNPDQRDRDQLRRLREFIDDPEVSVPALSLVAQLPGPVGPDILYDTWVNDPKSPETAKLAQEIIYIDEVRSKASPALKVELDLLKAPSCESVIDILARAKSDADRRSVATLEKLLSRRGCGFQQSEDCYPCLRRLEMNRKSVSIAQAITAARARKAPVLQ